jgi:hypothetical protein
VQKPSSGYLLTNNYIYIYIYIFLKHEQFEGVKTLKRLLLLTRKSPIFKNIVRYNVIMRNTRLTTVFDKLTDAHTQRLQGFQSYSV